jgi:IclR family mhp operon transcriptional activator
VFNDTELANRDERAFRTADRKIDENPLEHFTQIILFGLLLHAKDRVSSEFANRAIVWYSLDMVSRVATTRSLDRAVDILEVLATHGPAALSSVRHLTGLPKSTTNRLLEALVRRNLVRRGLSDGNFRINITMPRPGDATYVSRVAGLIKAAAPHLIHLTHLIGWPADLHIFHEGRMQIIETTHALSPFEAGTPLNYNLELNVFAAASGIAYLSTLPEDEVRLLIRQLESDEHFSLAAYRVSPVRLFKELDRARLEKFGRRLVNQISAGRFSSVAVPIRTRGRGVGAISVWWPRAYRSATEFWKMHGKPIYKAGLLISEASEKPEA